MGHWGLSSEKPAFQPRGQAALTPQPWPATLLRQEQAVSLPPGADFYLGRWHARRENVTNPPTLPLAALVGVQRRAGRSAGLMEGQGFS